MKTHYFNIIKYLNINTRSIILICGDADDSGLDCNGTKIPFKSIYKYLLQYINYVLYVGWKQLQKSLKLKNSKHRKIQSPTLCLINH